MYTQSFNPPPHPQEQGHRSRRRYSQVWHPLYGGDIDTGTHSTRAKSSRSGGVRDFWEKQGEDGEVCEEVRHREGALRSGCISRRVLLASVDAVNTGLTDALSSSDLIDDPEVNAVYIAVSIVPHTLEEFSTYHSIISSQLPNIMHYEWTMKALDGGKHVLVEKPITTTSEDARKMHELAETKGLVLLEAMHNRLAATSKLPLSLAHFSNFLWSI